MKLEHVLTTIIVTLVITFVSWTGLQIIDNAQASIKNATGLSYITHTLERMEDKLDAILAREK